MKYWRGYLVALILAALSWALVAFAKAHSVLVDMIYPYVTRLIISSMADWTGGMGFCLWQVLLVGMVALGIVSVILMILFRWNPIQWGGWVLAVVMFFCSCHTVLYGLNQYASPLADDMRLDVTDYTVSELNEATVYFQDQAKQLSLSIERDDKGNPKLESFETLAAKAGDGFKVLAYDQAMSVFAGSTAPVKKLGWSIFYGKDSGVTFPLTGEAAVNPRVPTAVLPFAMCEQIAHRMSIDSDADAQFAAFLAGANNPDPAFRYSAYLMAYKYCYDALASIPTSTAKTAASQADAALTQNMRNDLQKYTKFFGERTVTANLKTTVQDNTADTHPDDFIAITFSEYSDVSDLLASWYIQTFIVPLHKEEVLPFNPVDPNQVDLTTPIIPPTTYPSGNDTESTTETTAPNA